MSILKIAQLGHPILYQKASVVDNITEPSIKKLIHDMSETMLDYKGIGLAAPQVHISKQIVVFRVLDEHEKESNDIKIAVLINPKITEISEETNNQWEGCLSIPGMLGLVKRYSSISYEGYGWENVNKREKDESANFTGNYESLFIELEKLFVELPFLMENKNRAFD